LEKDKTDRILSTLPDDSEVLKGELLDYERLREIASDILSRKSII
jgi:hypothetical protein